MPKPNYQFEKRQRELDKKRKKAEKLQRKAAAPEENSPNTAGDTSAQANDPVQAH